MNSENSENSEAEAQAQSEGQAQQPSPTHSEGGAFVYFTDDEGNPLLPEAEGGANEADDDEDEGIDWRRVGRSLLNGEFLRNRYVSGQVLFLIFIVVLALLYTGNRYSSQQEIILIDSLKAVVQQEQYNVLTQSSELLNLMRQSNIEQALRQHGDTTLLNPVTPPFEILGK